MCSLLCLSYKAQFTVTVLLLETYTQETLCWSSLRPRYNGSVEISVHPSCYSSK